LENAKHCELLISFMKKKGIDFQIIV